MPGGSMIQYQMEKIRTFEIASANISSMTI